VARATEEIGEGHDGYKNSARGIPTYAEALGAEDLEEIVADYSDDAIFITPAGIKKGKDAFGSPLRSFSDSRARSGS
jgi:ketosteroid isomerase-like protein